MIAAIYAHISTGRRREKLAELLKIMTALPPRRIRA
jgi:hypothetical protein